MKKLLIYLLLIFCLSSIGQKTEAQEEVHCDILWQDVIFGKDIGFNNSLISYDYDNDSIEEIFVTAKAPWYGYNGYWYILKFNPENDEYEKVFVSDSYEREIDKMILGDTNGDGNQEVIFSIHNKIHVVSLEDFSTLGIVTLTDFNYYFNKSFQIALDDIDQDGQTEIITANEVSLAIINSATFELENEYEIVGARFDVGNVDQDNQLELVFTHGSTYEISPGGILTEEYDFRPDMDENEGFISLQDTDGDLIEEAFISDEIDYLHSFNVYDGTINLTVEMEWGDINAMILHDVTGDSIKEIIYGENSISGKVYCLDALTGEEYWQIYTQDAAVRGIAFGDFDNDQTEEIVWSTRNEGNIIYVYSSNSIAQSEEWKSISRVGPFFIIDIFDIDDDGEEEIVTVSKSSNEQWSFGIVTVFNLITKEIENQMDPENIAFSNHELLSIAYYDYLNDGDMDFILVSGYVGNNKLWIFDGDTFELEAEQVYESVVSSDNYFNFVEVYDIDDDGEEELIITSSTVVRIINSQTLEVEWTSDDIYGYPGGMQIVDVVGDSKKEIVVSKNQIYIIKHTNGNNYNVSQSPDFPDTNTDYQVSNVVDWNNDGALEIIAGLHEGIIKIIDPTNLEIIETFVLGEETIRGIQAEDINNDGIEEVFITTDNYIYSVYDSENFVISQKIIKVLGMYEGFKISDYDNDGNYSIFLGTANGAIEIDANCLLNLDAYISENESQPNRTLSVFPNPAVDYLNITNSGDKPISEVKLYTVDGKLINIQPPVNNSNSVSIKLPNLISGIYLLRVKINDVYQFKKFVVE